MAINFDQALGIHEQALKVRTARAQLIANNLANKIMTDINEIVKMIEKEEDTGVSDASELWIEL